METVCLPDSYPHYALYKGSTWDLLFQVVLEHGSRVAEIHLSMGGSSCNIQKGYSIVLLCLLTTIINVYN
jgi:hypothetical protein